MNYLFLGLSYKYQSRVTKEMFLRIKKVNTKVSKINFSPYLRYPTMDNRSFINQGLNVTFTEGEKMRRGFTLLEVLIALAIVGGLLVTVIYSLNYHLGLMERHETITRATLLAREKLHEYQGSLMEKDSQEGYFDPPDQDFHYRTGEEETGMSGVVSLSVTVTKGKETVTLRRLVRQ